MPGMKDREGKWMLYAFITLVFWGVWGALIDFPKRFGFPNTLTYVVWSISMIIPCVYGLNKINWQIERSKSAVLYGLIIGFTGAGGQLILFTSAIENGPAYLIFPFISMAPVITILLSYFLLHERTNSRGWIGILLALIAIPLLSYDPEVNASGGNAGSNLWIVGALLVFISWGCQAFFIKTANRLMSSESIFFYMTITGLSLAPVAFFMTDFSIYNDYSYYGPLSAFFIQILNAIGALSLVMAFRYGKAIIVSPLTNAAPPVITIVISLILFQVFPSRVVLSGMVLAIFAVVLMSFSSE